MKNVEKWCMEPYDKNFKAGNPVPPRCMSYLSVAAKLTIARHRTAAILRHYSFPGPFSIELTAAVMRQSSFIQKMVAMGWAGPGQFRNDIAPLVRSVARYHAFLDLLSATPGGICVPTLVLHAAYSLLDLSSSIAGHRSIVAHSPAEGKCVSVSYLFIIGWVYLIGATGRTRKDSSAGLRTTTTRSRRTRCRTHST